MEVVDRVSVQQRRQRRNAALGAGTALAVILAVCVTYAMGWWPFNTFMNIRPATSTEIAVLQAADMLPPTADGKVYIATGDVRIHTTERMTIVLPPYMRWKSGALNRVSLVRYHQWKPDRSQFERYYDPFCELAAAIDILSVDRGGPPKNTDCIGFMDNQPDPRAGDTVSRPSDAAEMRQFVPGFDAAKDLPAEMVFGDPDNKPVNFPVFRWLDGAETHTLVLVLPLTLRNFSLDYDRLRLVDSPAVIVNQFCLSGAHPAFPEAAPRSFASKGALQSLNLSCDVG